MDGFVTTFTAVIGLNQQPVLPPTVCDKKHSVKAVPNQPLHFRTSVLQRLQNMRQTTSVNLGLVCWYLNIEVGLYEVPVSLIGMTLPMII